MADQKSKSPPSAEDPALDALTALQKAGFGNMVEMSTTWAETLSDMSAEVLSFMAERIKEDVRTQQEILHCKDVGELQHIQSRFVQKAMDQYQEETGKLVEMGTSAIHRETEKD